MRRRKGTCLIHWRKTFLLLAAMLLAAALIGLYLFKHVKKREPGKEICSVLPPHLADGGDPKPLLQALDQSLAAFDNRVPKDLARQTFYTPAEVRDTLSDFKRKLTELGMGGEFLSHIASNYRFKRNCDGDSLVTGYFESEIEGDLSRHGHYQYPLYRPPPDLERAPIGTPAASGESPLTRLRRTPEEALVPYFTREQIDYENKLNGAGLELVWLKSRLDRTFLQIQGSGLISLPDGSKVRAAFADRNGHPYTPIGRYFLDRKMIEQKDLSMQFIRKYVEQHPEEERAILSYDLSYIFFILRPNAQDSNPHGSLGVPLTPFRSIAIDPSVLPIGALAYLDSALPTFDPEGKVNGERRFQGFVLNQDSGIAIKSAGHIDLFCGRGAEAELLAGSLQHRGHLYVLSRRREG